MPKLYGNIRYCDFPCPRNVSRLDHLALPLISSMHHHGIRVDLPYLRHLEADFSVRQAEIASLAHSSIHPYQDFDGKKYQPFSLSSPDQVSRLLFKHLRVQGNDRLKMTKSEKHETTSDDVLELYRSKHEVVGHILDYREIYKLLNTYVLPIQAKVDSNSRIHTEFSTTTAATGRLASRNVNQQNIPTRTKLGKLIRQAFVSSPGNVLVSSDLSQIEMRWTAHLSQDPTMMSIFRKGQDIHDRTACEVFGRSLEEITSIKERVKDRSATTAEEAIYKYFTQFERLPSKTLGFGILYGQTEQGLYDSIMLSKDPEWSPSIRLDFERKWTLERCRKLIEEWYSVYSQIRIWMDLQFSRARRWGMVWDAFGRHRPVPEVYSVHKRIKAEGLRKAGNHPIQASACGTMKIAMGELYPLYSLYDSPSYPCWPLISVHDEIISEVHNSMAQSWADTKREVMENATPISVPIRSSSDIAERWGDLK